MRNVVNTLIVKTTPNVLVTLFKFLDDGPARTKIGNIIKKIAKVSVESFDFVSCVMLLGDGHPFILAMKAILRDEQVD